MQVNNQMFILQVLEAVELEEEQEVLVEEQEVLVEVQVELEEELVLTQLHLLSEQQISLGHLVLVQKTG
jgi:hypothetical protein